MQIPEDRIGKMKYIEEAFMTALIQTEKIITPLDAIQYLDSFPAEFRSVVYEAGSMAIALADIAENNNWKNWRLFYQHSSIHRYQVELGLGLAMGKLEKVVDFSQLPLSDLKEITVFNGLGYFYALFRGRRTVKQQQIPFQLKENALKGFDQGVGRRLWYISKGDLGALKKFLEAFENKRLTSLWTGIGIAVGYVGGNSDEYLYQLKKMAQQQLAYLQFGICLAVWARLQSSSMTPSLERALKIISEQNITAIQKIYDQTDQLHTKKVEDLLQLILTPQA